MCHESSKWNDFGVETSYNLPGNWVGIMAVSEEIRNSIIANIPVNRLGTSEEIAALVDFLASEEAGFATGADFSMNGGQHMMWLLLPCLV